MDPNVTNNDWYIVAHEIYVCSETMIWHTRLKNIDGSIRRPNEDRNGTYLIHYFPINLGRHPALRWIVKSLQFEWYLRSLPGIDRYGLAWLASGVSHF